MNPLPLIATDQFELQQSTNRKAATQRPYGPSK